MRNQNQNQNQRRNNNRNNSGNEASRERIRKERPIRKKVDRDTEVIVMNNTFGRFIHNNPRMNMVIDLEKYADEEYVTVGDLRTIANTSKKILEGFDLIIVDVPSGENTVKEVVEFLGLGKRYEDYFEAVGSEDGHGSLKDFVLNTTEEQFERNMNAMDKGLRNKVIDLAVKLFKMKKLRDFGKMEVIEDIVGEDLFDDAKLTEIDLEID